MRIKDGISSWIENRQAFHVVCIKPKRLFVGKKNEKI